MDLATVLGIVLGFGLVIGSILMGGSLTVQSEDGQGTTFTIVLPYESPETVTSQP